MSNWIWLILPALWLIMIAAASNDSGGIKGLLKGLFGFVAMSLIYIIGFGALFFVAYVIMRSITPSHP
jgi:hypothetical protein